MLSLILSPTVSGRSIDCEIVSTVCWHVGKVRNSRKRTACLSLSESFSAISLFAFEPVYFQTIPQMQPGTVKHDPKVVYFDAQNLANFFAFKTLHLAQCESTDRTLRQWRKTVVKNLPEIAPFHQLSRSCMPIVWRIIVVPVPLPLIRPLKKLPVLWPFVRFLSDWSLTTDAPKVIDDLVF